MKTVRFACASLMFFLCTSLFAQTPAKLAFEVASIKPSPPLSSIISEVQSGKLNLGMRMDGSRVDLRFMSLTSMLSFAYKVKAYQIAGPDWLKSQMFEIHAKLPEGSNKDQVPEMMQTLLAERFKLTLHRETRDLPVYALIVGKNGPKLKEAEEEPAAPAAENNPAKPPAAKEGAGKETVSVSTPDGDIKIKQEGRGMVVDGGKNGQMRMTMGENGSMRMEVGKMKMPEFAELLTQFTDRQVIDMTDLKGSYQVALDLPLEELMNMARRLMPDLAGLAGGGVSAPGAAAPSTGLSGTGASDPTGGAMFQAVQQLGLKLDPRKVPTETIVVDHIEKDPTEN
jgi:uncharacterized protein (TIGR03435 family)